jgi:hypothetical protein
MFEGSPEAEGYSPVRIHNLIFFRKQSLQDWQSVSRDASWLTILYTLYPPHTSAKEGLR